MVSDLPCSTSIVATLRNLKTREKVEMYIAKFDEDTGVILCAYDCHKRRTDYTLEGVQNNIKKARELEEQARQLRSEVRFLHPLIMYSSERINDTSKCYHERIYFDDKVVAIIQDYYKPTNIGLMRMFHYVITSTNECAAGFYTVADAKTELFQLLDAEHLATK